MAIEPQEGDMVTLTFGVQVPEAGSATRSMASESIQSLHVIVFDEMGYYLTKVAPQAVETGTPPYDPTTRQFEVSLPSSNRQRVIHFVANIDADQYAGITSGNEDGIMTSLYVEGEQDTYWQRMVYGGIGVDSEGYTAPNDFFGKDQRVIPLVRNFAKVTVQDATGSDDNFILTGFKVFNTRQNGSIAAYDKTFIEFCEMDATTDEKGRMYTPKSYSELSSYACTEIGELQNSAEYVAPVDSDNNPNYIYVRETSKTSDPFIIIKGTYNGSECYYKLDFIVDGQGDANILRNFAYNFVITSVTRPGTSEDDAIAQSAGENGASFDSGTQSLLNISDGVGQLAVSATTVVLVSNETYELKYKYVPNIAQSTTTANGDVTLSLGDGSGVFASDPVQNTATDADGWSTITVTSNVPDSSPWKQQIVLNTPSGLARTVTFYLMQPYQMTVNAFDGAEQDREDGEVPASTQQKVWVDVTIPSDVQQALFPLEFVFESSAQSLYPDAAANNMPVRTGQTIIPGSTATSFGFTYTLTWDAYSTLPATDDGNGKIFTANFLTNKAANASTVYVYNEYFALGSDAFTNPSTSGGGNEGGNTGGGNEGGNQGGSDTDIVTVLKIANIASVECADNALNKDREVTIYTANNQTLGTRTFSDEGPTNTADLTVSTSVGLKESDTIYFSFTRNGGGKYTASVIVGDLNSRNVSLYFIKDTED